MTFVIASCSDSSAPTNATTIAGVGRLLSAPARLGVVTRDTPLATAQSASATVGVFGGQISLPGAGLTVIVAPFAVTAPTTITVTAVAGNMVAYEFEPHGIHFNAPVVLRQDLTGTSAAGLGGLAPMYGGYFPDLSALDPLTGTALVDELLQVSLDRTLGTATFSVTHFSGYLLGTAEGSDGTQ